MCWVRYVPAYLLLRNGYSHCEIVLYYSEGKLFIPHYNFFIEYKKVAKGKLDILLLTMK